MRRLEPDGAQANAVAEAVAGAAGVVIFGELPQRSKSAEEEVGTGAARPGEEEPAAGNLDGDDGRRGEVGIVAGGVGTQAGLRSAVSGGRAGQAARGGAGPGPDGRGVADAVEEGVGVGVVRHRAHRRRIALEHPVPEALDGGVRLDGQVLVGVLAHGRSLPERGPGRGSSPGRRDVRAGESLPRVRGGLVSSDDVQDLASEFARLRDKLVMWDAHFFGTPGDPELGTPAASLKRL
ncbi:hypothetical protein ACPCSP_33675 [Streptomyces cinereoruber]|uniref:hypothetical protein n=1 Tax=Streptomyces cinereoruber TaxID=67260 RepID=UPI003C303458